MKIGFYDSGLGGADVLNKALSLGLKGEIYFLADIKNRPYGIKSKDEVLKLALDNVNYLISKGCSVIVIACNTATSVSIDILRKKYKDVIFLGIEPALKIALSDKHKKVLVLATTNTIKGEKLDNLINTLNAKEYVSLLALDTLVNLVEDESFNKNKKYVDNYLKESLKNYNLNDYSHIVLGCTHFPIAKKNFKRVLPKDIKLVDGSVGISKFLLSKIKQSNEKKLHLILTKKDNTFIKRVNEVLDKEEFDVIYKL